MVDVYAICLKREKVILKLFLKYFIYFKIIIIYFEIIIFLKYISIKIFILILMV